MRATVERLLQRVWRGERSGEVRVVAALLTPLSWMWGAAAAVRGRRLSSRAPVRIPGLAIVSVGNLAVGGTGKTPLSSWIARRYAHAGARPALVLSGYGRDEELLHRRWTPDVPVVVGRDRSAAARRAGTTGADVAVLDDGFQHRRLARDLDIVLLAIEQPFPGHLLPRGPYREPASALERAHAVVITRRSGAAQDARALAERVEQRFPGLVKASVRMTGGRWLDLDGAPAEAPAHDVLAAAAVARPATFGEAVQGTIEGPVELVAFADHHEFTAADARRLRERAGPRVLVVTEKDAVKLAAHRALLGPTRVLAQDVAFDWGEEALRRLLDSVVPARSV